jgi:beta-lactamase class A
MGKESDNTAVNIARRILGQEKIEEIVRELGMSDTVVVGNNQKTTPKDIATFFQRLSWGGLISDESKDELLEFMTNTIYEDHLVAGVDENIKVAHKYGRELHIVNDAGIVFSQKPYVVVIMSKGVVDEEADSIFPQLSKIIYEAEFEGN